MGILGALIPLGMLLLFSAVLGNTNLYAGIGGLIGCIITWMIGKKLNKGKGKMFISEESGKKKVLRNNHSLFWLNMEIWGIIFGIIGITSLLSDFINNDLIIQISKPILIIIVIILAYRERKKEKQFLKSHQNNYPLNEKRNIENKNRFSDTSSNNKKVTPRKNLKPTNLLTEEQKKKKKIYEELRNSRDKVVTYKPTNHNDFMPSKKELNEEE